MRKNTKQGSAVPLLDDVPDHVIASLVIQISEYWIKFKPTPVYGAASQWPIPHTRAVFSLLLMVREERSKLDPETAAYEVSRLKYYLTAEKDVRHVDAKVATKMILSDNPTEYRRREFAKFVKANPYLAKLFYKEKSIRQDQLPLIRSFFESMEVERRKKSARENAARRRRESPGIRRPKKVKNIFSDSQST
jgi:UDP:flavonoid glycosyltransferase YjiC (YdhE family)